MSSKHQDVRRVMTEWRQSPTLMWLLLYVKCCLRTVEMTYLGLTTTYMRQVLLVEIRKLRQRGHTMGKLSSGRLASGSVHIGNMLYCSMLHDQWVIMLTRTLTHVYLIFEKRIDILGWKLWWSHQKRDQVADQNDLTSLGTWLPIIIL